MPTRPWASAASLVRGGHIQPGDVDEVAKSFDLDIDQPVVEAVHRVAAAREMPMSQIAIVGPQQPVVDSAVIGASRLVDELQEGDQRGQFSSSIAGPDVDVTITPLSGRIRVVQTSFVG